mmetsp:Transcript_31903/g.67075  ORF Transcript_31903/g.67075 Transcript_31903/m.67075 type:complete len:308 (-) Transcript_31903:41-964(-)
MAQTKSFKRFKIADIGIDSLDDNIMLHAASYLKGKELLNFALTCRRFGSKSSGRNNADGLSLFEGAAQQILDARKEDEKDALPRYLGESLFEHCNQLDLLRSPLSFDQLIGERLEYSTPSDKSCVTMKGYCESGTNIAICSNHVMRAGKHYATFTDGKNDAIISVGIIRPIKGWDKKGLREFSPFYSTHRADLHAERTDRWGESNVDCCMHFHTSLDCSCLDWETERPPSTHHWSGTEWFNAGDRISLLLDLNAGTLAVYKNGQRLGVMKDNLAGEYCWMTYMRTQSSSYKDISPSVSIKRGPVPAT